MYDTEHLGPALINRVWERARVVADIDSDDWRQDECGAWMRRDQYNCQDSDFGWRILDIVADHPGEPDTLRAFHVRNSFDVAQDRPVCRLHADRKNVPAGITAFEPRNIAVGG